MKDSGKESIKRAERKHLELQDRILAIPGTERILRKLAKAGANRENALSLLASAVGDKKFWLPPMRRKKRELEGLAIQLETLANHAQRVSLDPLSYGSLWMAILGLGRWEKVKSAEECAPIYIFNLMRLYAKRSRDTAKAFGNLLRWYPPRHQREMTDCLMLEIWRGTQKHYDKDVAFLLTNAFEAVGRPREVTEDQVKKHRQRYVMPRIKAYLLSHPATSGPAPERGTVRTP